jgi:hypothetical protein
LVEAAGKFSEAISIYKKNSAAAKGNKQSMTLVT